MTLENWRDRHVELPHELLGDERFLSRPHPLWEGSDWVLTWQHRRLLSATLDEIWITTLDEVDVPYIHRYRVDRECGGEE